MMDPTPVQAKVAARYRGLLVIWGGQFVSLAIFVALTRIVEITPTRGDDALRFQIFDVLGGAGLALSFVLSACCSAAPPPRSAPMWPPRPTSSPSPSASWRP